MTIAADKQLQSSDRFVLARLEPARYINDDLSLISASTYSTTFENIDNISKVQRNGADLTLVETITGDDQYTFDENTRVLTIQMASAPNESSNVFIIFHYLYLTTIKGRYFPSDPLTAKSPSNPVRFWEPRIVKSPTLEESYSNIINAVMTIKASSLNLNNADRYLNPFTTINDSFKNKNLQIYIGINDSLDILYTGPMNDISISDDRASVKFRDAFSKVNDRADMGGTYSNIFYTRSQYPNIDPQRIDKPKIITIGEGSAGTNIDRSLTTTTSYVTNADVKRAVIARYNRATNIDFDPASTSGVNRDHHLYRGFNILDDQVLGTQVRQITDALTFAFTVHKYYFSAHNLRVGQTFEWDDGGGPYYGIVMHVGDFDYLGLTYNVMVDPAVPVGPIQTSTSQFTSNKTLVVVRHVLAGDVNNIDNNYSPNYLIHGVNYTFSESVATMPTGINVTVTLDSAVSFDPNTDNVYWQADFKTFGNGNHAYVVRAILNILDIPNNTASFDAAAAALDMNVRTQIPRLGQDESLPLYRDLLEDILGSALTYLGQNKDGEAIYGVLGAISAGDVRSDNLILSGSQSINFGYNDIYQEIEYKNDSQVYDTPAQDGISTIAKNKSEYLHGESRTLSWDHVMDDISPRIQAHMDLRSSRQATYSYSVATEDIDTDLGEDVTIESDKITPSGTQNVKITSIKRSADKVQVRATDLGDLT